MDNKHYFETKKTARYFTYHNLSEKTEFILFAIHGYAQTAENLIEALSSLPDSFFVIAPEGLNRFYSRGFGGTPVANWMTSLERDIEIKDYLNYLDDLCQHLQLNRYSKAKLLLLGFSQGVATSSRWLVSTTHQVDTFIMVAGDIGNEMHAQLPDKLKNTRKAFFIGNQDGLIKESKVDALKLLLNHETSFFTFEGKHEINEACLHLIVHFIKNKEPLL